MSTKKELAATTMTASLYNGSGCEAHNLSATAAPYVSTFRGSSSGVLGGTSIVLGFDYDEQRVKSLLHDWSMNQVVDHMLETRLLNKVQVIVDEAVTAAVDEAKHEASQELRVNQSHIKSAEKAASEAPPVALTPHQRQVLEAVPRRRTYSLGSDENDED